MSTEDFGRNELERAELDDTGLGQHVLELLQTFAGQRHNDPGRVVETFSRLAMGMPLMPLLGTDDEWFEVLPGVQQNKRCATVFREACSGEAYDSAAYLFENPITGARMVTRRSRVKIPSFPYYPRAVIVQMTPPGSDREETLPALAPMPTEEA